MILGVIGRLHDRGGHDAAAAIVENGKIIAAIEQERLSRTKHAPGEGATEAILACLTQANLTLWPVVHTPQQAIDTFLEMDIDTLVVGHDYTTKHKSQQEDRI